jgi:hypothetical protein
MGKRRDTKRNVDLISSHSEDEDQGPSLLCEEGPTGLSQPETWTNENLPPHTLSLRLRPGETLVEYQEIIPDIDRNEYAY